MSRAKNSRIKRAHTVHEFTPEELVEFKRCAESPIYFCRNYVRVQHPKHGSIPLDLYPYQEHMMDAYQENRFNIILSARQTGKCSKSSTRVSIIQRSTNIVKRFLLLILDKRQYNMIYG